MKKSTLYLGIGYTVFGIICFAISLLFVFRFASLFSGLGSGFLCAGLAIIGKYIYWSSPSRQEEYAARLKNEQIELRDERKIMLRDKSGRITYLITLGLCCTAMFLLSICAIGGWFMPFARHAVILLAFLVVFQYLCGIVVFHCLSQKC